jgi:single-stranded-DNA-specific exonuclease
MVDHARTQIGDYTKEKLWVVSHESYEQGIIGLIAGRLTDEWSRPVIAVSEGNKISKGSARSIDEFDIVEAIASASDLLITYGGHPQAAGFTIETAQIPKFRQKLQNFINQKIDDEALRKSYHIDAEVRVDELSLDLVKKICQLEPFGIGNLQPIFLAKGLTVGAMRLLSENKHLRVDLSGIQAIGFGLGHRGSEIRPGMKIDALFHLEENIWQGRASLQMRLRDFRATS